MKIKSLLMFVLLFAFGQVAWSQTQQPIDLSQGDYTENFQEYTLVGGTLFHWLFDYTEIQGWKVVNNTNNSSVRWEYNNNGEPIYYDE